MTNATSVEIGKIGANGAFAYTVRIVENGKLAIEAHCSSLTEARDLADIEAERLKVDVRVLVE